MCHNYDFQGSQKVHVEECFMSLPVQYETENFAFSSMTLWSQSFSVIWFVFGTMVTSCVRMQGM